MKLYKTLSIALAGVLLLTGCNGWFDVTSSNEIREDDHYSKDSGFKQTLIGCYLTMSEENLYGMNLSWFVPDLIANQTRLYSGSSTSALAGDFQAHNYNTSRSKTIVANIWASGYNVIVNANEALAIIDGKQAEMDDINYHMIKGELLAVRAFMHFQLLRLYGFGPQSQYAAQMDSYPTIPYVTTVNKNTTAQATYTEFFTNLVNDLKASLELLKGYDPVCGEHDAAYYENVNEDGFYATRNNRLNYYAVEAILAQVYMWEGSSSSLSSALTLCNDIINAVGDGVSIRFDNSNTFIVNLSTPATLNRSNASLINEALFAISVNNLDNKMQGYVNPSYADTDYNAIYLSESQKMDIYDDPSTEGEDESVTDVRSTILLSQNLSASEQGFVPVKLYQRNLTNSYYANKVPVLRLPEVYYMAAECYAKQGNAEKAMELVNVIREKRALYEPLTSLTADQVITAIGREYRKEFLGEGEIFYYYKRTGATSIPNYDEMAEADYLLPYPDDETAAGRRQYKAD